MWDFMMFHVVVVVWRLQDKNDHTKMKFGKQCGRTIVSRQTILMRSLIKRRLKVL